MRLSTIIILACMVSGIAVLCGLGFWQLDRLEWKENLIASVERNLAAEPSTVKEALAAAKKAEVGIDYRPVQITGEFIDNKPIFEFTTFDSQSGWNVYSLLKQSKSELPTEKQLIIINRGFIPFDRKQIFESAAVPKGIVKIEGLLRSPPTKQPSAAFDNDEAKRTFYWRDISAMSNIWKAQQLTELNWYIDAGIPNKDYGKSTFPKLGTTLINFPNSHLQYAFTWFGIAFALLGVGSFFLYSRRKGN